jgi:alginate O-acetyltransferase complex protein AlgJ
MPRRAAAFYAAAFALLMAWGFWQAISALRTPDSQNRLGQVMNLPSFLGGRTAGAFNHVMAHALPADPWLRVAGGALRYKLFGSGGPSVRLGCGNWLFLSEELRPWPDGEAVARERLEGVAQVARRLEAEGATVILALTPDKARVEHRHLCGLDYAAQAAARHDAAMRELRQTGLRVVEWLPVLEAATAGGDVYYRSDTHWNQRGAALAANAVAEAARDVALRRDDVVRTNTAAGETTHAGDLLRLMSLDRAPDALRPAPDRQRLEDYHGHGGGRRWPARCRAGGGGRAARLLLFAERQFPRRAAAGALRAGAEFRPRRRWRHRRRARIPGLRHGTRNAAEAGRVGTARARAGPADERRGAGLPDPLVSPAKC